MSLQEASRSIQKMARYAPGVVAELPVEGTMRIEINGVLAGAVRCMPDVPAELAVGWAFMHGFFEASDDIDSVTVDGERVSLMIATGADIDDRRRAAVGWVESDGSEPGPSKAGAEPFAIYADVLIDLVRDAVRLMAKDRSRDGFVHAAVASDSAIHCVARDQTVEAAVAKIMGWMVRDGAGTPCPVLIVRGLVSRQVVSAADRLGVSLIVSTGIPTADAFREAIGRDISMLGMATNERPGLLVDAGHVVEDDDDLP